MIEFVPFLVLAYLMGSVPTAVWYGRIFHKVDIREHGSGNAGATNSHRVLGKKAGLIVLFIDILKGFSLILITRAVGFRIDNQMLIGIGAVIGHLLPIFANFRGGKGVATSFGIILGINPYGALLSVVLFIIVVKLTKYVSLGALIAALSFTVFIYFWENEETFLQLICFVLFLLLCFTHRQNILRLLKGIENKYPPK